MITQLKGMLLEKSAPWLVIDVQGVGYELQASMATFAALPAIGEPVLLLTHFVVREDAQQLYGFANRDERQLFRTLVKISGVGPKLALAILSGMDADMFVRRILEQDVKSLTRLPGVGKKTAERLVIEMKDRLKEWAPAAAAETANGAAATGTVASSILGEAETALVALGYKPVEASRALAKLALEDFESSEDAIRAALKSMV